MTGRPVVSAPTDETALEAFVFRAGQLVEWWHVPRGGYGFGYWVPAVVIGDNGTDNPERRVKIEAQRKDGSWRVRHVYARNLRDAEFAAPAVGVPERDSR